VLWNPDSQSFALTDHAGSDYLPCSIIYVDEKVPTIDVWTDLRKRVAELSPHGNGFTHFYSYSIGGGIRWEKP
jgi:hypothetical protein